MQNALTIKIESVVKIFDALTQNLLVNFYTTLFKHIHAQFQAKLLQGLLTLLGVFVVEYIQLPGIDFISVPHIFKENTCKKMKY
jgi:hypothetical protein